MTSWSSASRMRNRRRGAASSSGAGVGAAGRSVPRSNRTVKVKVLPRPGVLRTLIVPPISPASRAAMVRPSPVPPYRRVIELSACSNAWKIFRCTSGAMPMPVSSTRKARVTSDE